MKFLKQLFNGKMGWLVVLLLLVLLNWLANFFYGRIDFTNEKRFTLSPSTKQLLSKLEGDVDVTVLLAGDIKSEFKKLATSTRELLENFKTYSGKKIQYRFELPADGLSDSLKSAVYDSLVQMGLRPTNQQVQVKEGEGEGKNQRQIFPGAVIRYGDRSVAIDLLQGQIQKSIFNSDDLLDKQALNSAEALLEFKFANAIQKLTQQDVPVVAYAYGNGEPPYGFPGVYNVFETLGRNFVVDTLNLKQVPFISPSDYNAMVIVKPTEKFTDEDKFKLDQYVMKGGHLFFLIDVLYAERDSMQNGDMIAYARELNLNDLLFRFGARINTDLIADKHCDKIPVEVGSIGGQSQKQLLPWPYAPLLQPGSEHPIVKNQADVLGQFVNSIDLVEAENVKKTVLLSTSNHAYSTPTPAQVKLNSLQTEEDISRFNKKNIPIGVLLEGRFTSMYSNRLSQALQDSLRASGQELVKACTDGKVIIVSDADIVMNQVSETVGPLPMGVNKYTKVQYANKDFFLNCTEYLANKKNILDARAKDYTLRLLDVKKVADQRSAWQMLNIVLPVLLVGIFALVYQWQRKRKFSR
jgi:gliding-associated putative ABC transporter substrate-binding component GldG